MNSFSFFNVHGLKPDSVPSKVPFISDTLHDKKQLFIGLTETWLKTHKDAEINIEGYQIFRADRKRRKKKGRLSGGVAAYICDEIANKSETKIAYSDGVVEVLGLHSPSENLFIAIMYRQPDDSKGGYTSKSKELKTALSKLAKVISDIPAPAPNIIFGGDFNLPHASWPEGIPTPGATKDEKEMLIDLNNFCDEHFLKQHITTPTHVAGNTLDLLFTNNDCLLHSYACTKPLQSTSDHYIIEGSTQFKVCPDTFSEAKPDFMSPFDKLNFHSSEVKAIFLFKTYVMNSAFRICQHI